MLLNERDSTCASPPLLVATHSCQDVVAYRDSIVSISKQSHGISVRTEAYTSWNDTMALGKSKGFNLSRKKGKKKRKSH
jgi:hypothetical protein